MRFLPFVWAMLWRRRARTWLTFLSIVVAFFLFGMLESVNSTLRTGTSLTGADRLMISARFGIGKALPYAHRSRIETVDGVVAVSPIGLFGASYQDPGNFIPTFAVDPKAFFAADSRFIVAPEYLEAFARTRTGLLAGRDLAIKYGWTVGDRVPLLTNQTRRKDGTDRWEFDLVGVWDFNPEVIGREIASTRMMIHYDGFDEARVNSGQVTLFAARIRDSGAAGAIAEAIDAQFRNSAHETRTQTEHEFQVSQVQRIGDIGLITRSILGAVFFTLVLLAGNTMLRSFQERIPELAVLKTLGFTDARVSALMAVESLLLCGGAGALGLALAWAASVPIAAAIAQFAPVFAMDRLAVLSGLVLAAALGTVAALIPAVRARRMTIVAALARR